MSGEREMRTMTTSLTGQGTGPGLYAGARVVDPAAYQSCHVSHGCYINSVHCHAYPDHGKSNDDACLHPICCTQPRIAAL